MLVSSSYVKESFYMVFTSTYHYFYPASHFETANGIHSTYVVD